jgi:uncharacterized protein
MDGMLEVLRLISALGSVTGRKKLQKIVHILKSQGYDFPQHFGYLHYGPYSSALAAEVDALVDGKLIAQRGGGGEYDPYVYTPSEPAKQLLQDLKTTGTPRWKALAQELNTKDANYLEAMSTILYLQANGFEGKTLRERFASLKPNLKGLFDEAHRDAVALSKG